MELFRAVLVDNLKENERHISATRLRNLPFWQEYCILDKKIPYISELCKAGVFTKYAWEEEEYYDFGYDLMRDFLTAKIILRQKKTAEEIRIYIQNDLLQIVDGGITQFRNVTLFIILSSLYAEKYHEECIDVIDQLEDRWEYHNIISDYMVSFSWRKTSSVKTEAFKNFVNSHPVPRDVFFKVLIENSAKPEHPLNAEFLHSVLIHMDVPTRDALWTSYANSLSCEEERIYQLVILFQKGENLENIGSDVAILILILFSWLLACSNRLLRDQVSYAMINILNIHFDLAEDVLKHFKTVNDPYIYERLHGVVYGACLKRKKEFRLEFKKLAIYIYDNIFKLHEVYADILLRDYARMIIERWNHEFPMDNDNINMDLVRPPYHTKDIPIVEKQEYKSKEGVYGFSSIARSMYPDRMPERSSIYGNFGRYVFESALCKFEGVNVENAYHYAMQYIRDELGYADDILGEYDSKNHSFYYGGEVIKIERIGKKYQWIAMHHVLAYIADTYELTSKNEEGTTIPYDGPWQISVRDFEPTLNTDFYGRNVVLPISVYLPTDLDGVFVTEYTKEKGKKWAEEKGEYLKQLEQELIYTSGDTE